MDITAEYGFWGTLILVLDLVAIASVLLGRSSVLRKVVWIFVILLLPLLGMLIYFLFGRSKEDV